jgi:hypothetical protein
VVRVHNGPPSISTNSKLVYHDLIARGRQVETARRWRSLVQSFEACCGVKNSYDRAYVVKVNGAKGAESTFQIIPDAI